MKKYISMIAMALLLTMGFTACDVETNEKPGGTNIEKMCGYWDVTIDAVDENGELVFEDPFGMGEVSLYTYNNAANSTTQMWLDDREEFWNYKFLVDINYEAMTFSATERDYDAAGSGTAIVTDGKIVENGGLNLHDKPCDTIEFYISFSDDENAAQYGFAKYHIHGTRHTGFTE